MKNLSAKAYTVLGILGFILILGIFLRVWNLSERSFSADEFLDINAAYGYHILGERRSYDFNLEQQLERQNPASDERAWIYREQIAFLFNFVPPTEFWARIVSVAWGVFSIVLIFFITVRWTRNPWIALIAAFFFSISISALEFNRMIRMYAMFLPVFLALSYSIYQLVEAPPKRGGLIVKYVFEAGGINIWWIIPTVILGVISLLTHQLTANIVLVFALYCLIRFFGMWNARGVLLNRYLILLLLLILALCMFFIVFPQLSTSMSGGIVFFQDNWSYLNHVFVNYAHIGIAVLIFFFGLWYLVCRSDTRSAGLWIFSNVFAILCAAIFLWSRNTGAQYIFFIHPFIIILLSSGVWAVSRFFYIHLSNYSFRVSGAVLILSVLFVPNYAYFFEENTTYHQNSQSSQPNYREVFAFINGKRTDGEIYVTRNFRNYYFAKQGVAVVDFGGERTEKKITVSDLRQLENTYPGIWVVFADNDEVFFTKEARTYMENEYTLVDNIKIRGAAVVYHWQDTGK